MRETDRREFLKTSQGDRVTCAAAVVEIEVNKDNGRVVARHVYGAIDCGMAINPGIVEHPRREGDRCRRGSPPRGGRGHIGNAFFDATGVRLRQFPLTPPRVLAALGSAADGAVRSSASTSRSPDR